MKCPKCQTENREGAEFCKECGEPLQAELICSQCGHVNTQDSKFCDKCGNPLTKPAPASTPEAPPPPNPPPLLVDATR
ncbi:MAG TPA: zinc ribbon domain-containing protein [Dehalococcoidia bacterium]|nr:zinc ribbon domain-containing protein [Dehalococcoidia bacterium]